MDEPLLLEGQPVDERSRIAPSILPANDAGGSLGWVIGVMTALAMLGLAATLALTPAAGALSGQIAGRATIQIVEPDPVIRQQRIAAVRAALTDQTYVTSVVIVPERELRRMATRWLGDGAGVTGVPLPALIDVDLSTQAPAAALDRLRGDVRAAAPAARVIGHASWLGPVARLVSAIGWLAAALAIALVAAAATVAVIAARAGLAAQRPTIAVLHLVGATDLQIARMFQRHTARGLTRGALAGGLAALVIVGVLGSQMRGLAGGLTIDGAADGGFRGLLPYISLLAVPPMVVVVAMVTARRAVLQALRHMP